MELLILWLILAVVVAIWAYKMGRSAVGYFFLSLLLSPVIAGVILLVSGRKVGEKYKKCPECAEIVKSEAKICRFCGHDFTEAEYIKEPNRKERTEIIYETKRGYIQKPKERPRTKGWEVAVTIAIILIVIGLFWQELLVELRDFLDLFR
jgi:hypothetical protein